MSSYVADAPQALKLPNWLSALLALAAGAIFSWALAPYFLWPIALISPMIFYALLLNTKRAKQAFWLGECYGFGTWAVGAFWLFHSIHNYGGVPVWLALVMIAAMASIMGLFYALMAWVFVRFLGKQPLAFAGLWVLQEWLKTWLLTGFPWLFVGYAFTEVSWLNALAPITGVLGLSFLAVLFAASTIELFRRRGGFMVISAVLVAAVLCLARIHPAWTTPTGERLSVSLVQGNIPQSLKWQPEHLPKTLQIYDELSRAEWGRDLVVWPEAAVPLPMNELYLQESVQSQLQAEQSVYDATWAFVYRTMQTAKQAGSTWVTGVPYQALQISNDIPEPTAIYNSVMAFDTVPAMYFKQNLVPFGEYIPFAGLFNILPNLAGMESGESLSAGEPNQPALAVKNQAMGVAICYEVAYPETTRQNAQNADFLLTVSNDAWFGESAGPMQHLQMVQMRSLETGRWFVRATNNGVTAIINEQGQLVKTAPQFEQAVLRGEVLSFTGQTPYMRWGFLPMLLLSVFLVILSALGKRLSAASLRYSRSSASQGVAD